MNELVSIFKHPSFNYLYAITFNRIPDVNIYMDIRSINTLNRFITSELVINEAVSLRLREFTPDEVNSIILPEKELIYREILLHIDDNHDLQGDIYSVEYDTMNLKPMGVEFALEHCEVLELVNKLLDIHEECKSNGRR